MAINLDELTVEEEQVDLTRQNTAKFLYRFFEEETILLADLASMLQFKNKARHIDVPAYLNDAGFSLAALQKGEGKATSSSGKKRKPRGPNVSEETKVKHRQAFIAILRANKEPMTGEELLGKIRVKDAALAGEIQDRWTAVTQDPLLKAIVQTDGKKRGAKWSIKPGISEADHAKVEQARAESGVKKKTA